MRARDPVIFCIRGKRAAGLRFKPIPRHRTGAIEGWRIRFLSCHDQDSFCKGKALEMKAILEGGNYNILIMAGKRPHSRKSVCRGE